MTREVRSRPETSLRAAAETVWRRFYLWQTPFSFVSGLMPMVLVIVFLVDFVVGHEGANRPQIARWMILFGVATVVPFVMGRRFPRWLGLVMVGVFAVWIFYFIVFVPHTHAHISAMLELPVVALYLGWFYPPRSGRSLMLACVAAAIIATVLNPGMGGDGISRWTVTGYAVLIAGIGFEGGILVRRMADVRLERDELTGALNRRGLVRRSSIVLRDAARTGSPISCVVIDFDDFKRLNDTEGHAAGDAALRESVIHWVKHLGRNDLIARTGGDEFVILLHRAEQETRLLVDEIRSDAPHPWSVGIAERRPWERLDGVIARADERLYAFREERGRGDAPPGDTLADG